MRDWLHFLLGLVVLTGHLPDKHKLHPSESLCDTDQHCALLCKQGDKDCDGGPAPNFKWEAEFDH